uniref:ubiquitin carboxyl-terminal hydrolase 2 n=1 Tax=Erigeron canadensis TaxID=72917 RepID=UPI001CB95404|nr:ubiquitin carboxyl-terminal hydrolase 2 [Erigeron canadensis]
MGKKVKKRNARTAQKEKQVTNSSQKIIPTTMVDGASVAKEARVCPHLETGINFDNVTWKITSSESRKCDDCREVVVDRRASKGKQGKKKSGGSSSESTSIWVCLQCGHFTCGGVGFPTTPHTHATRHAKQYQHPLAVKFANPNLRWCFRCDTIVPAQTTVDGEQKDILYNIVKLLKAPPSSENSLDVEDVWFGSGSILNEIKTVNTSSSSEVSDGFRVKGLLNLGNTCFFNSILQNLLAMDKLRDHFLRLEKPVGPLAASLKKLFIETNPSAGPQKVVNPWSLFNSVCAIAPQFKGYQQQDSHELLRFLLDGLCTEESKVQSFSPKHSSTFVDTIFGGQISSSVSCLECGHTSIVYEPYLDLSLPLPTKKGLSKKMPLVSRSKKFKPPPKRRGKVGTKVNTVSHTSSSVSTPAVPTSFDSLHAETNVIEKISEITIKDLDISSDKLALVNYVAPTSALNGNGNQTDDSSDQLSWLDYLDPPMASSNHDAAAFVGDDMVMEEAILLQVMEASKQVDSHDLEETQTSTNNHDAAVFVGDDTVSDEAILQQLMEATKQVNNDVFEETHSTNDHDAASSVRDGMVTDEAILQQVMEASKQIDSHGLEEIQPSTNDWWLDYLEPSFSQNDQDMSSQHEQPSAVQDSGNGGDVLWEDEPPLIQESEVLLLPYESLTATSNGNEVTLSSVSYEQEPSDFDGFGGLFDEPEVVSGPTVDPISNGARNNSESDSDEVDNTDSQVSVDKCLSYFTTSELLTKAEHAWHCEHCSKALLEQRMKLKNKPLELVSNGAENGSSTISSDSGVEYSTCNGLQNDKSNGSRVGSELEENGNVVNGDRSSVTASSEASCAVQDLDFCNLDDPGDKCKDEKFQKRVSSRLARKNGSNGVEDEDSSSIKVTRDATKRILINRVPPILTVHLKRLSQDARGRLSKLSGHVDFKEIIDLKPYMDSSCKDRGTYRYRLIGVVEHIGTMRGGHYVAYVRGGTKGNGDCLWYHASDAHVRQVSFEEVLRCEAYILFYEMI